MPLTKKNQEAFERARRRHRIVFSSGMSKDQWPECYRKVVDAIETAKTYRYITYKVDQDEIVTKPWKNDAKRQAKRLVQKSIDCVLRNEATWRLACESLVFSRLAAEVACKICRQRVWRAEIESSLSENNRAASSLRKRQEQRRRCQCPMTSRANGEEEMVGLNKLFIDRADDVVVHPPSLAEQLPQDQRPDRVYGLRQTRKFEDLLLGRMENGEFLEDRLHEQPHSISGEPLLFPFMVVEAKAGNASDEWYDIKLQTAFPIYTYLQTQQSVRIATGQKSRWDSGPLVWFFGSRGDDWRLFLAFPSKGDSHGSHSGISHDTMIVPVWTGCISNPDGALQLFLIVDFIADWARDVYRASIMTELRILSAPTTRDVSTVGSDTFIFSSRSLPPATTVMDMGECMIDAPQGHNNIEARFKQMDSSFGVIRHVTPIESCFKSLFITEDNVQTFLSSIDKNARELFTKRLLSTYDRPQHTLSLTAENINAIERAWTGTLRGRTPFNILETKFSTLLIITYYLSPLWEQTRELCLISVTERAFHILDQEINSQILRTRQFRQTDFKSVIKSVAQLKTLNSRDSLASCISRTCLYLDHSGIPPFSNCFEYCNATAWELVNYIYKEHKRGDLEPDLTFLRLSRTTDIQSNSGKFSASFAKSPIVGHQLRWSKNSAILIHGGLHRQSEVSSPLCVFVNELYKEPPDWTELAKIITTTFEDHDIYHTTRDSGTLKLRTWIHHRDIWNLGNTYGVFFSYGEASFPKWLKHLGFPLPSRQGSPRGSFDTGRSMYERKYNPWEDPRISSLSRDTLRRKFVRRLIFAEALVWARLAQQSIQQGNDCCSLCGGELSPLCDEPKASTPTIYELMIPCPWIQENEGVTRSISENASFFPKSGILTSSNANKEVEQFENLCPVCAKHLCGRSYWGEEWQEWMKAVLRKALWKSLSDDVIDGDPTASQPYDYCISTLRQGREQGNDYSSSSDEFEERTHPKRRRPGDDEQPSSSKSRHRTIVID